MQRKRKLSEIEAGKTTEQETTEQKTEEQPQPSLVFHSSILWRQYLYRIIMLEDGIHFAAVTDFPGTEIQIWNIQTQKIIFKFDFQISINSLALLKGNTLAVASTDRNISLLKIDMQTQQFQLLKTFPANKISIDAMTLLKEEFLVAGAMDGSITIWNLTTQEKIHSERIGSEAICALDTLQDDLLVIAEDSGMISIYNYETGSVSRFFGNVSTLRGLTVLPDDSILCADIRGCLRHFDREGKLLGCQQVSTRPIQHLIQMANGLVGCVQSDQDLIYSLQVFKPSWIQDFIDNQEIKTIVQGILPVSLAEIVASYTSFGLFRAPRLPHNRECVLTLSAPKPGMG